MCTAPAREVKLLMDPSPISSAQWSEIGKLLTSLWLMVAFVILFATNMIIGHNAIPSLVASQHLPVSTRKLMPIFYGLAVASFTAAMFFLSRAVDFAGVLRGFWADYWI